MNLRPFDFFPERGPRRVPELPALFDGADLGCEVAAVMMHDDEHAELLLLDVKHECRLPFFLHLAQCASCRELWELRTSALLTNERTRRRFQRFAERAAEMAAGLVLQVMVTEPPACAA